MKAARQRTPNSVPVNAPEVALSFGAYEFFWVALFGVTMSGTIVGNDPL